MRPMHRIDLCGHTSCLARPSMRLALRHHRGNGVLQVAYAGYGRRSVLGTTEVEKRLRHRQIQPACLLYVALAPDTANACPRHRHSVERIVAWMISSRDERLATVKLLVPTDSSRVSPIRVFGGIARSSELRQHVAARSVTIRHRPTSFQNEIGGRYAAVARGADSDDGGDFGRGPVAGSAYPGHSAHSRRQAGPRRTGAA